MRGNLRFALILSAAFFGCGCVSVPAGPEETLEPAASHAPFLLTLDELERWTPESPLADAHNRSAVPLARRFVDPHSQLDPAMAANARVLVAPDGIDGLANYLEEQPVFNLYNFTYWSSIDVLNWFGGTAELNVSIPARPWIETAHRNGVKVLGTVFFAPKVWGGSEAAPLQLLRRNENNVFPYADKLIEIAAYYGFDGWLINQETDLTNVGAEAGEQFLEFMAYLVAHRPSGMEIHWYDSMLPGGGVAWQNELNGRNRRFLQDGIRRTSDAVFLNYWWPDDMLATSIRTAESIGRSPYDVYAGADLWPDRKAQSIYFTPGWLDALGMVNGGPGVSLALFANNYNFTFRGSDDRPPLSKFALDDAEVDTFYRAGEQLFGGDDGNPAVRDPSGSWPGIGSRIPARSVLTTLPFKTTFSTGHGKIKAQRGAAVPSPWHDISAQDILPTWQFAVLGNTETKVAFDFDRAYEKGNSLRIEAVPPLGDSRVPLFKTHFEPGASIIVEVAYALSSAYDGAYLWFESDDSGIARVPLINTDGVWSRRVERIETGTDGRIIRIGLGLRKSDIPAATMYLGELSIREVKDN